MGLIEISLEEKFRMERRIEQLEADLAEARAELDDATAAQPCGHPVRYEVSVEEPETGGIAEWCSICSDVQALREENAALREVLEWYADEENHERTLLSNPPTSRVNRDSGKRARKALERASVEENTQ